MFASLLLAGGLVLTDPVVVDGDTLRVGQERYRVENIDAPERGRRAACIDERALGEAARAYVLEWIALAGRVEALTVGRRDRYGRVLTRIEIDGADLGERLIAHGLARRWRGRKSNFCVGEGSVPTAR